MIFQALSNYYDILRNQYPQDIPPLGYGRVKIAFEAIIDKGGELRRIIPVSYRNENNQKNIKIAIVPQQQKRASDVNPNFLCDNPSYCFGFYGENEKEEDSQKKHEAFIKLHLDLLDKIENIQIKTFVNFLKSFKYNPELPIFKDIKEGLSKGGAVVFRVDETYLHENELALEAWEQHKKEEEKKFPQKQCAILGEIKPIALLHPSLKGIRDAQSSGASIVSYNCESFESYDKKQGENSSVSEEVSFKYTTILNYLLEEGSKNKIQVSDSTTVFWAETANTLVNDFFSFIYDSTKDYKKEDKDTEKSLNGILENIKKGKKISEVFFVDENTKFYILGLSPNASRISIRFFYSNTIKTMINNYLLHQKDLEIETTMYEDVKTLSNRNIFSELENPNSSKEKLSPLIAGSFMRSIFTGSMYPRALFSTVMNRVFKDHDDKNKGIKKINNVRVAIIKAYLLRYFRFVNKEKGKEVLTMSLNQNSNNFAYLLGRLFAILEKAQKDVNPDIGATIKDRFFSSACATPSIVFPTLLKLVQNHISKNDFGQFYDKKIAEIMELFPEQKLPKHLNLDDQGIFIIGYYHQMNNLYIKKEQKGEK